MNHKHRTEKNNQQQQWHLVLLSKQNYICQCHFLDTASFSLFLIYGQFMTGHGKLVRLLLNFIFLMEKLLLLCLPQITIEFSVLPCISDHRRSWVIFRGGPTIPSCQNSSPSCQNYSCQGGPSLPILFCHAKLLCQTVLPMGKHCR